MLCLLITVMFVFVHASLFDHVQYYCLLYCCLFFAIKGVKGKNIQISKLFDLFPLIKDQTELFEFLSACLFMTYFLANSGTLYQLSTIITLPTLSIFFYSILLRGTSE